MTNLQARTTEPTLTAMQAATEKVREANHAAYDAPRTVESVYGRTGAWHDLLSKVKQQGEVLADTTTHLAADPRLRSNNGDAADQAGRAQASLRAAVRAVEVAIGSVDDAWGRLSSLYLDEET